MAISFSLYLNINRRDTSKKIPEIPKVVPYPNFATNSPTQSDPTRAPPPVTLELTPSILPLLSLASGLLILERVITLLNNRELVVVCHMVNPICIATKETPEATSRKAEFLESRLAATTMIPMPASLGQYDHEVALTSPPKPIDNLTVEG